MADLISRAHFNVRLRGDENGLLLDKGLNVPWIEHAGMPHMLMC